jgi:hypothetical protein
MPEGKRRRGVGLAAGLPASSDGGLTRPARPKKIQVGDGSARSRSSAEGGMSVRADVAPLLVLAAALAVPLPFVVVVVVAALAPLVRRWSSIASCTPFWLPKATAPR